MPSEFDVLVKEIQLAKEIRSFLHGEGQEPLRKALPGNAGRVPMPGPSLLDIGRLNGELDTMLKSFGPKNVAPARRSRTDASEQFLKSVSAMNQRVGESIAAGQLSAHEACVLTARLHRLGSIADSLIASRAQ